MTCFSSPQVEFKQAKDYVTTIKKRFANEPHQATYKAFLKILHHYQARPAVRIANARTDPKL